MAERIQIVVWFRFATSLGEQSRRNSSLVTGSMRHWIFSSEFLFLVLVFIVSPFERARRVLFIYEKDETGLATGRDNITRTKPTNLCELRLKPPLIASSCDAVAFFFSTWRTFLKIGSYVTYGITTVRYWVLWASPNETHRINIYHLKLMTRAIV